MTKYNTLEFEKRGAFGMLTLNRPDRLNAVSAEMITELRQLFGSLMEDYQTLVVIVQGKGRGFCAGADLTQMADHRAGEHELGKVQHFYNEIQQGFSDIVTRMRQIPQPLIAGVRGPACGAGFAIALACDVIIAGQSARFNAAFVRIGASGTDMASSYFLPRRIGLSRASEYLLTGRFMDAQTAERFGMASRVVPDDKVEEACMGLAEEIAQNAPFGIRMTKEGLNLSASSTLETAIALENRTQTLCVMTEDVKEGPKAFLEKRKPVFRDQ